MVCMLVECGPIALGWWAVEEKGLHALKPTLLVATSARLQSHYSLVFMTDAANLLSALLMRIAAKQLSDILMRSKCLAHYLCTMSSDDGECFMAKMYTSLRLFQLIATMVEVI